VEIRRRVDKVTQKRRFVRPYRRARMLCDHRCVDPEGGERDGIDRALSEEILGLVCGLAPRPTAVTGHQRSAYLGRDTDLGLRVTFDRRVLGRDRDFRLGTVGGNRCIVPAGLAVIEVKEVKADERVPFLVHGSGREKGAERGQDLEVLPERCRPTRTTFRRSTTSRSGSRPGSNW
jgi:hypothetical protein